MDSIKLASIYLFNPKRINYQVEELPDRKLYDYILGKEKKSEAEKILKKSTAVMLFLELIARKNKKKAFDSDVIEAYFIGNELLDNVNFVDMKKMIEKDFVKLGLKVEIVKLLVKNLPKKAIPSFNFQIMHASILNKEIPMLSNINDSRISFGRVIKLFDEKMLVAYNPLEKSKIFSVKNPVKKEIIYDKEFLKDIKENDFVSIKQNFALQKLTKKQVDNVEKYTNKVIEALNTL